tara:strand:- start:482 stop:1333 length:852 start_codon:yes stop_codon:yes gene_type:complete
MILIDFSQVMLSNIAIQLAITKQKLEIDLVRHMILNSLRKYRSMFNEEFGELVICCDGKDPWRKKIFPSYKANRKKSRESDDKDWDIIFELMSMIRTEIAENLPYKVIHLDGIEADDVIAVIVKDHSKWFNQSYMIVSSDKDFKQLQKYPNVFQYSPIQKKKIYEDNPKRYIKEHILIGDTSDGIPNFLSPDDTFINGIRQQPINKKKLQYWIDTEPKDFCNEYQYRNYQRNQRLIDFDFIPEEVEKRIMDEFKNTKPAPRSNILPYFTKTKLRNLVGMIQEF